VKAGGGVERGRAANLEAEEVAEVECGGGVPVLDRGLFVVGATEIDVLRRAGSKAEPHIERKCSLEHPTPAFGRGEASQESLEGHALSQPHQRDPAGRGLGLQALIERGAERLRRPISHERPTSRTARPISRETRPPRRSA
jgi:hypothetical protein